jgi:hypothetical protein
MARGAVWLTSHGDRSAHYSLVFQLMQQCLPAALQGKYTTSQLQKGCTLIAIHAMQVATGWPNSTLPWTVTAAAWFNKKSYPATLLQGFQCSVASFYTPASRPRATGVPRLIDRQRTDRGRTWVPCACNKTHCSGASKSLTDNMIVPAVHFSTYSWPKDGG